MAKRLFIFYASFIRLKEQKSGVPGVLRVRVLVKSSGLNWDPEKLHPRNKGEPEINPDIHGFQPSF